MIVPHPPPPCQSTGINLNNILCPAVSDPFKGLNYRASALLHQTVLTLTLGKCITVSALSWGMRAPPPLNPGGTKPRNGSGTPPTTSSNTTGSPLDGVGQDGLHECGSQSVTTRGRS